MLSIEQLVRIDVSRDTFRNKQNSKKTLECILSFRQSPTTIFQKKYSRAEVKFLIDVFVKYAARLFVGQSQTNAKIRKTS